MTRTGPDVQATFCATLVDEWVHHGVGHAVVSPGSRSTPMALALTDRDEIAVHVVHDERSAAFVALGLGLSGTPAVLLCTSGTAAANFFPAVVEARLSEVPMIVVTADRPEELRGVGAPQTIDQLELYGAHVTWFRDAPVPDDADRGIWREMAADAWVHAARGPVQYNLAFREPLVGHPGPLPEPIERHPIGAPTRRFDPVPDAFGSANGVILAGGRSGVGADDVLALQRATGWPLVADPTSELRPRGDAVAHADALLRHRPFAEASRPEVIVRIGRPAASKVLAQWSAQPGITLIQVGGPGVIDPDHNVAAVCDIASVLAAAAGGPADGAPARAAAWHEADRRADAAIVEALAGLEDLTEPGVARCVADHLPEEARVVVASSMPVRDLEWFGGHRARAHANRGANGIDGVTSTALGLALAGHPTVVLLGDLAFVHDSSALVALAARDADLRIVVVDNDGGGIFSFLPQATTLDHDRFEQLFGTPLGVDVVGLAAAHGVPARSIDRLADLAAQLASPGPWVARIGTDRARNVEVHDHLNAAVAAALG